MDIVRFVSSVRIGCPYFAKHLASMCLLAILGVSCTETNSPESERFDAGPILFVSDKSGTGQLYSMNEDGSDVKQLTHDPNFPITDARWSPDGSMIAVESPVGGVIRYGGAIYVMNADGTVRRRVTPSTIEVDDSAYGKISYAGANNPIWSPDSRSVALTRMMVPEALANSDIFVIDLNGKKETRITKTLASGESVSDWSPDGKLFLANVIDWTKPDARVFVAIVSQNGEIQQQLTPDSLTSSSGYWSPDQRFIVFTSWGGVRHELYLLSTNGSSRIFLPTTTNTFNYAVDWSPAGDRVMLNSTGGQSSDKIPWQIVVKHLVSDTLINMTPFKGENVSSHATSWRRR